MTDNGSARIDQYLFGEMGDPDHENFEAQIMADDALFYAVADRENDLVDRYVKGSLGTKEADRFRSSLENFPARQQKVSNAKLLGEYIAEGRTAAAVHEENAPWYKRLGFAFQAPAIATVALALLLVAAVGFLLVQNRGLQNDVALLEQNTQVDELKRREAELRSQLEEQQLSTGDLTTDLDSERENRAKLESELADLRKQISNSRPANSSSLSPVIAALVLRPVGGRGGTIPVRTLPISEDQKRVSVKLFLPSEGASENEVVVKLNGNAVGGSIRPRTEADGQRSVTFTVPADKFMDGINHVVVYDKAGKQIVEFPVNKVQR